MSDEWAALRIPASPGGGDNFICGLAVDTTAASLPAPHPDPEHAPHPPPQPLLLVGTGDGALRLVTLGRVVRGEVGVEGLPGMKGTGMAMLVLC